MRRSDKEINEPELIKKIIDEAEFVRIALCDDGEPYIIPMNFGYQENTLYLHSATEGRKIDILRKNERICFQMDINIEMVQSENPCKWGMKYLSVVGFGKAQIIENELEKKEALDIIMSKYSSQNNFEYTKEAVDGVIVIKVDIDKITGKKSGY